MTPQSEFSDFLNSWRESVVAGDPSTIELGRRFAHKVVMDWLDAPESGLEIVYCDGAGDGGIDLAVLDVGPEDEAAGQPGHTWYLVQSKHGTAFAGARTLLVEAQKVIETLDGRRTGLNSLAEGLRERLGVFRSQAGPNDRIVLVFATERALTADQRIILSDIRTMGREHIGGMFDVEAVSVETIHARLGEEMAEAGLRVALRSHLVPSGPDLLVGSTKLADLYGFLVGYRDETGDLDGIYEKNVRRFLGGRGKVNKGMQDTLRDAPERFGLYNNGITIVASDWTQDGSTVELVEPYIVNGCQTSRTIWEVFHRYYRAGGTGINPDVEAWKERAGNGAVVTKIVKVGTAGEQLLQAITRYTNSQNAVREKDFLTLSSDFTGWKAGMAERYGIYLEVQRGGWDSQKALQNANPSTRQFNRHVNAAELIKVYGAGWLGEAGVAFGKNPPFLPGGAVFKRITALPEEGQEAFGVEDLYACYRLQEAADALGFGRGGLPTRRQSRFIFYMVTVSLLKDVLNRAQRSVGHRDISLALAKVLDDPVANGALIEQAVELVDSYFTQGSEDSVFEEPALRNAHFGDLNAFLKAEKFGRTRDFTPRLFDALALTQKAMGKAYGGQPSARDTILAAVT
jgi:hypothetical protein